MKRDTHLLEPGPAGVEFRFVGEFMLLLDAISKEEQIQNREVSPLYCL